MKFPFLVAFVSLTLFLLPIEILAQQIRPSSDRRPVGSNIVIRLSIPEQDPAIRYRMGIARAGSTRMYSWTTESGPYDQAVELGVPVDPGPYEVILRRADDEVVVQSVPLEVYFAPTPGALSLSTSRATAGETISVSAQIPEGRYTNSPWIGLFRLGRNTDGGTSIADERWTWDYVPAEGGTVNLVMPRWPGRYEIRLFDRRDGPFVLDAQQVEVFADPAPGMLSLNGSTFEVGAQVTATVTLDRDRHFGSAWMGLFRPESVRENGVVRPENRLNWEWVDKNTMQSTFFAPSTAGTYEIRVFDDESGAFRFELDRIAFEVQATPQPGAIDIAQTDYIIGAPIDFSVNLKPNRFYGSPWVGLFDVEREPAPGNAPRLTTRYTWDWVANGETEKFYAPAWPGNYQLRLYDRDARYYLLDTIDISVTAPPTPGVMALAKTQVEIGEPIKITTNLEPNRYYGSPYIGIFSRPRTNVQGGARITTTRVLWDWVRDGEEVDFGAINRPGIYDVRLYDRDGSGYVLDTTQIEVVMSPTPGVLTTDKDVYRVGEPITINVDLPQPRYYGSPWVGLVTVPNAYSAPNAPVENYRLSYEWVNSGAGPYTLTAPWTWGTYRVVVMDRQSGGVWLDEKEIKVIPKRENLIRVSGRSFAPGAPMRLQIRWPDGLPLAGPKVTMHRSSYVTEGGALAVEIPLQTHWVRESDEILEMQAPSEEGLYEFRFTDRNQGFYILDIEEFAVVDPVLASATRTPRRLTPMPGEGRSEPSSTEGLPGTPRLPSDSTPAEDQPATDTDGDEPANDGTETAENTPDTETPQPESQPSDSAPENSETPADGTAGPPQLAVMTMGPSGMVEVTRISPGQSFLVQARFEAPPQSGTVTAELTLGGNPTSIVLRKEQEGVYRSGVVQMPTGAGEDQ